MTRDDLGDTIAAIATSLGEAGIGIVRVSGKDALAIADKIFVSKDKQKPSAFKTHTVHYGWIVDSWAQPFDIVDFYEVVDFCCYDEVVVDGVDDDDDDDVG